MAVLTEQSVQKIALRYLDKRYRKKSLWRRTFARPEVRTHKKFGGKRADGLIAFRHWLLGVYVVSIEAKSAKTLPAIRPYSNIRKLLINSLRAGLMCCLLSGAFLALLKMNDGWLQFVIPLNVLAISALLYGLFTLNSHKHQLVDVIDQIRQYPANAQWLAFSKDGFMNLSMAQQEQLRRICQAQGIGILMVKNSWTVEVLHRPSYRWKWFGDFLKFYSKGGEIRKQLR
ncbi:MAG: hypothetical protein AAF990_02765 [Bacteroidota bacterium]